MKALSPARRDVKAVAGFVWFLPPAAALLITGAAALLLTGCTAPALAPPPHSPPSPVARTALAAPPPAPAAHLIRWRCDWVDFGQFTALESCTNLAAGPWHELARIQCDGREVYQFADAMDAPAKFYRFKTWLAW
jgi:hypothetical protein